MFNMESFMKTYLKVPFADKDAVKQLGAKWDGDMKSWYIPDGTDESAFSNWETHTPDPNQVNATKIYISVPFADKDAVKAAGGRWDGEKKSWYYSSDKDASLFAQWSQTSSDSSSPKSSKSSPKKNQSNYSSPQDQLSAEINQMLDMDDPPF